MSWKRLTFILIPHSQSTVKQFSVPRVLIYGAVAGFFLATFVMLFYVMGFKGKEFYLGRTDEISRDNELLEASISSLDSTLAAMSAHMDSIESADSLIREEYKISAQDFMQSGDISVQISRSGLSMPLNTVIPLMERYYRKSLAFEENFETLFTYCLENEDFLKHVPSIRPAQGYITKEFGSGVDMASNTIKVHEGVDINNVEGTPVFATADGVVEEDTFSNEFGRSIIINHQNGYRTRYAHLQTVSKMEPKIKLKTGEKISRGQQIGSMGRTGRSFLAVAPHLMYTVEHHGVPVDPIPYFFASDFSGKEAEDTPLAQKLEPLPL